MNHNPNFNQVNWTIPISLADLQNSDKKFLFAKLGHNYRPPEKEVFARGTFEGDDYVLLEIQK